MEYTIEGIQAAFAKYWRANYDELRFFLKGDEQPPTGYYSVSVIEAVEGEFGNDCNFFLKLSFQFQVDCIIAPTRANCTVKVGYDCSTGMPVEQIEYIDGNRINITRHGF